MKCNRLLFLILAMLSLTAQGEKIFNRWEFKSMWQPLRGPVYITTPVLDYYYDELTDEEYVLDPGILRYATLRIFGFEDKGKQPVVADFMLRGTIDHAVDDKNGLIIHMPDSHFEMTDSAGSRYAYEGALSLIISRDKKAKLTLLYLTFADGTLSIDDWTATSLDEPVTLIVGTATKPKGRPVLHVATHD